MLRKSLVKSFNSAFEGLMYTLATQRNVRLHLLAAVLVICLGVYLSLPIIEITILLLLIAFVIVTEVINTAIETMVDLIGAEENTFKQTAKNVAASAVLVASITAITIGYIILIKPIVGFAIKKNITEVQHYPWQVTLLSLIVVLLVITAKKLFSVSRKKIIPQSLEGGMPSGHSAVSFSIWTAIAILSKDVFIIGLAFVLVVLILQSRIKLSVHNLWETLVGGFIGILVTVLIFQLLS